MQHLKLLFLFLFLNIAFINAQETNYIATYKVNFKLINLDSLLTIKSVKEMDINMQSMMKQEFELLKASSKNVGKIRFMLEYNSKASKFSKLPLLAIEEEKMKMIQIMLSITDDKIYTNKNNMIREVNAYGQDFLIDMPKIEWQITNITKKIGKYTCYKATATRELENSSGKFAQKIVAWFTPQIPFNYGPKYYNGLPGLIVQLKEGEKIEYVLISIKNKPKKNIEFPTKGKKINYADFTILGREMYENRKN